MVTICKPAIKIITLDQLASIAESLQKNPIPLGLDLETTGLNPRENKIVALMFGTQQQVYILDVRPFYAASAEERLLWITRVQDFLLSAPVFVGHNLKFDWSFLFYAFGIELQSVIDTQLQEQVLYGIGLGGEEDDDFDGERIEVNLKSVGSRYGFAVQKEERAWFYQPKPLDERPEDWYAPFPQEQIDYMGQDIVVPMGLYRQQQFELEQLGLLPIANLENSVLPAFAAMECAGCMINRVRWEDVLNKKIAQKTELAKPLIEKMQPAYAQYLLQKQQEANRVQAQTQRLLEFWQQQKDAWEQVVANDYANAFTQGTTKLAFKDYKKQQLDVWVKQHPKPKQTARCIKDEVINLASPSQVAQTLQQMGYKNLKKDRATGDWKPSSDRATLEKLLPDPFIVDFLTWRKLDKFISSFGEKILEKIERDGRIHPEYNQIGAKTGRTSCKKPNWQQLPSHEPEESSVRMCVVARPGYKILTCDLPNIELRILAELSQEPKMLDAFAKGIDLHSDTARMMFNLSPESNPAKEEIRPGLSYRSVAKTINFGLAYGMGAKKLSGSLKVDLDLAEELFSTYKQMYPVAWNYLEESGKLAVIRGYSQTPFGRKLFFNVPAEPDKKDRDAYWKYANITIPSIERRAKNAPIQGCNADITKYAMFLIYQRLPKNCLLTACIHDEVVLEAPVEDAEEIASLVSDCMTEACKAFLHTVHIPQIDVEIEDYWKKG